MAYLMMDYETASFCDLKRCGADRYAEDLTTEILVLSWKFDDAREGVWHPGDPMPEDMRAAIADPKVIFIAHNVRFERAIWREIQVKQYDWPELPAAKWHDTMARCAQLALPQKLELALLRLNLAHAKDTEGSRLTISLSKPNRKGYLPARTPEIMARVDEYNMNDVDAQTDLHRRIGWLADGEREVWLLDQKINDRGVKLDLPLVRSMQRIVDKATAPLASEFRSLTGGLNFSQGARVLEWCRDRGVHLPNMQKETLAGVLGDDVDLSEDELDEAVSEVGRVELPDDVRRALTIRQLVGSASIKKLDRMVDCVGEDGRARGLLQYHGAMPGRWAGRLLQPQNFPRGTIKGDIGQIVDALMTGDPGYVEAMHGPAVETVVSSLRYTLIPGAGRTFVAGDFAGIEARVTLATAGQWDKVSLMASGADVYCDMAKDIYGRPITKADVEERQTGKNSVLGLGFQMGATRFHDKYCANQPFEFAEEVVQAYRRKWAPMVQKLWYGLNTAAVDTVHTGVPHEFAGIEYAMFDRWLTARLPSGRRMWYYDPKPTHDAMPWDKTDIRPGFIYWSTKTNKWKMIKGFGGLLTENVAQGLARDLMVAAAFRAEANGYPVVLTVHDELVTEPVTAHADPKELEQIMSELPTWAVPLKIPVATEAWQGDRYRK